ncbi:MAG: DUF4279 domain-containing protein [Acidimicrobiales bacterium]|nr:DUF4279 domain-containing protein [Acidimicrobiales bacterium]
MSADEITAVVGVPPTMVRVKGERGRGNAPAATKHLWSLSTMDHVTSLRVSDHLQWLEELLEGRTLPTEDVTWDVFVFWMTDNGQGGPDLTPEASTFLAERRLPISFDIHY